MVPGLLVVTILSMASPSAALGVFSGLWVLVLAASVLNSCYRVTEIGRVVRLVSSVLIECGAVVGKGLWAKLISAYVSCLVAISVSVVSVVRFVSVSVWVRWGRV